MRPTPDTCAVDTTARLAISYRAYFTRAPSQTTHQRRSHTTRAGSRSARPPSRGERVPRLGHRLGEREVLAGELALQKLSRPTPERASRRSSPTVHMGAVLAQSTAPHPTVAIAAMFAASLLPLTMAALECPPGFVMGPGGTSCYAFSSGPATAVEAVLLCGA